MSRGAASAGTTAHVCASYFDLRNTIAQISPGGSIDYCFPLDVLSLPMSARRAHGNIRTRAHARVGASARTHARAAFVKRARRRTCHVLAGSGSGRRETIAAARTRFSKARTGRCALSRSGSLDRGAHLSPVTRSTSTNLFSRLADDSSIDKIFLDNQYFFGQSIFSPIINIFFNNQFLFSSPTLFFCSINRDPAHDRRSVVRKRGLAESRWI